MYNKWVNFTEYDLSVSEHGWTLCDFKSSKYEVGDFIGLEI